MLEGFLDVLDFVVDALVAHEFILSLVEGDVQIVALEAVLVGEGALAKGNAFVVGT